MPSGFCGLYSKSTLANARLTVSDDRLAGAAMHDAGDDDVVHLDDEVLLLALARLAMGDGGFLQVLARRARLQQQRRRLVDVVNDGQILEGRLAGAAATTGTNGRSGFVTPQENDSTSISSLCLASSGFAFDVADLCKDVRCHLLHLDRPIVQAWAMTAARVEAPVFSVSTEDS